MFINLSDTFVLYGYTLHNLTYLKTFNLPGPGRISRQKYSKIGMVDSDLFRDRGVEPEIAELLSGFANFGLASNTL